MHVDAQQSLRLDTGEGTLGLLDIDAPLIIDFAVQRRTEVASRALSAVPVATPGAAPPRS
jgi:hypothetical protein